jgi:response regulator of citrate/malate metabolism
MVTAANDAESIASLFVHGVTDYLVKPFTSARFQDAISRFLARREVLKSSEPLSQEEIDRLNVALAPPTAMPAYMEKGIQQSTVDLVMGYLVEHPNIPHSLEHLSDAIGLSRVTIRRYMNHLVKQGVVEGSICYATGGRPSSVYCYRPKK